jgi:hypothetical protein
MSKLSDKTIQAALKRVQTTRRMERIAAGDWLALLVTASGVGRWQQRCRYGGKATSPIGSSGNSHTAIPTRSEGFATRRNI